MPTPKLLQLLRDVENPPWHAQLKSPGGAPASHSIRALKQYLARLPLSDISERHYAFDRISRMIPGMGSRDRDAAVRLIKRYFSPAKVSADEGYHVPSVVNGAERPSEIVSEKFRVRTLVKMLENHRALGKHTANEIIQIALDNYEDGSKVRSPEQRCRLLGALLKAATSLDQMRGGSGSNMTTTWIDRSVVEKILLRAGADILPICGDYADHELNTAQLDIFRYLNERLGEAMRLDVTGVFRLDEVRHTLALLCE